MCVLCGSLPGEPHWAERRLDAARTGGTGLEPLRRRDRFRRTRLLNRVLRLHHLSVHEDASGTRYVVANGKGAAEVVAHLGELWPAADRLGGRLFDPLDRGFLDRLEEASG